jgi:hypothetical protein
VGASRVQYSASVSPRNNDIACEDACASEPHGRNVIVENASGVQDSACVSSQDNGSNNVSTHYEIVDDTPLETHTVSTLLGCIYNEPLDVDDEVFEIIEDERDHQDKDEYTIPHDVCASGVFASQDPQTVTYYKNADAHSKKVAPKRRMRGLVIAYHA